MNQYIQAPHVEGPSKAMADAPNAALLIDFDNVTMGMRSDLSKELKSLLQSDVIRGKVTVQRAYADWRRYPQYIVPLSEASVDLIFAPAYGSSKKNATDIRMAIDGMELVFVRPEIGTYILLTGDSDFSSLVLKLKEYGKYVIGVGIQESSSDILVQNCDEYYSYTSLTGLRKTTDTTGKPADPWELVGEALARMTKRKDVMRSDRLKQVMIELDASFDEGGFGFSKFSKFLAEAASRGIVQLHKLENGQYEVKPARRGATSAADSGSRERKSRGPASRRTRSERPRPERSRSAESAKMTESSASTDDTGGDPLRAAYDLMLECLRTLKEKGRDQVRDSDVKRKMLERRSGFDEAELGFAKFSKFLLQAEEHGVVNLEKTETGNYRVSLVEGDAGAGPGPEAGFGQESGPGQESGFGQEAEQSARAVESGETEAARAASEPRGETGSRSAGRLGPRGGSGRRRDADGPVFFEGQAVGQSTKERSQSSEAGATSVGTLDLPTGREAMIGYLTNAYKGVGKKTAEALVEAFGDSLFEVFQNTPQRVNEVVPRRAEQVLAEWRTDYSRRTEAAGRAQASDSVPGAGADKADEGGSRGGRQPRGGRAPKEDRQSQGGSQSREERASRGGRQSREERSSQGGRQAKEDRSSQRGRQPREERQSQAGRQPEGGRPPRGERQSRPDRESREASQTRGEQQTGESQSDSSANTETGQPSQERSSSKAVPRGRGGARRTRRGSRRPSPGSDNENG